MNLLLSFSHAADIPIAEGGKVESGSPSSWPILKFSANPAPSLRQEQTLIGEDADTSWWCDDGPLPEGLIFPESLSFSFRAKLSSWVTPGTNCKNRFFPKCPFFNRVPTWPEKGKTSIDSIVSGVKFLSPLEASIPHFPNSSFCECHHKSLSKPDQSNFIHI